MTTQEIIEKIRAEIERRIEEYNIQSLRGNELADLLSFLDTLQEPDKPINLDFEQELYNRFGMVKDFTLGMRIGKYFYELGKQEKPTTAEGLEEEIQNQIYNHFFDLHGIAITGTTAYASVEDMVYIARHFAQWQKEQMMKEAVEGWVARDGFGGNVSLFSYKPYRPSEGLGVWKIRKGGLIQLPKKLFKGVKWEDEPIKVRAIIVNEDEK